MLTFLSQPWPWYISGFCIALIMAALLFSGKTFGFSSNLRTMCSILGAGKKVSFFNYDWKAQRWNLLFLVGAVLGGFIASTLLKDDAPIKLASSTINDLGNIGIKFDGQLNPSQIYGLDVLTSFKGISILIFGGILVGFGTRYAGGCTSGHAITGLANLQIPSLIAVVGFFIGGLVMTFFILPLIF
ncbi:MAG: YeeE/YedE family protein [Pedobacter sp.]|nr:YeeE/YedE family protein [Pedobacter sp.]